MLESNCQCYFSSYNTKAFAANMIVSGSQTFMRASHIRHIDDLESMFTQLRNRTPSPEMMNYLTEFILDTVPDWVRIIICFENYMKAVLLEEGYLIHKLDRECSTVRTIANQQNRRPIKLDQLKEFINFSLAISTREWVLEGLKNQTLNFNVLLRPKYQEVVKLPDTIFEAIRKINNQRNNLHFYHEAKNSYNPDFFRSLRLMYKFVQNDMMGKAILIKSKLQ